MDDLLVGVVCLMIFIGFGAGLYAGCRRSVARREEREQRGTIPVGYLRATWKRRCSGRKRRPARDNPTPDWRGSRAVTPSTAPAARGDEPTPAGDSS